MRIFGLFFIILLVFLVFGCSQGGSVEIEEVTIEEEEYELFEGDVSIVEWQPMRLVIPSIEVDLAAVGGGDVFDPKLLEQGPTHFQMSDLPNTENGNVAFAGLRAGRSKFFLNLDKIEEGDEIYLDVDTYRFVYIVEWVKVTGNSDWGPIETTDTPVITLQTSEPPYVESADFRLNVRGNLKQVLVMAGYSRE